MPIRPEDFDASAPRRIAPDNSSPHNGGVLHGDDQKRKQVENNGWGTWLKEHASRRAIVVTIAASAIVLTLLASEKPLAKLVRNLLSEKKPAVVESENTPSVQKLPANPPHIQEVPTDNIPPATVVTTNDIPFKEPKEQPLSNQTRISKPGPAHRPIRKPPADETPQQNDEAQALKRELEEKQAELERKQKELSDAQLEIEEQKQAAQADSSGPAPAPLGLKDVEMSVKLMSPMGTSVSTVGDGFSAMVLAPRNYAGAILAGHIASLRTAKDHDKPEISFQIESLTFQDTTHLIQADLKEVANSKGFKNVDEQGHALGKSSKKKKSAVAGGIFGAAMRGAKTAVVGSGPSVDLLFTIKLTTSGSQIELVPGSMFTLRVSDRKQR